MDNQITRLFDSKKLRKCVICSGYLIYEYYILIEEKEERRERRKGKNKNYREKEILARWIKKSPLIMGNTVWKSHVTHLK